MVKYHKTKLEVPCYVLLTMPPMSQKAKKMTKSEVQGTQQLLLFGPPGTPFYIMHFCLRVAPYPKHSSTHWAVPMPPIQEINKLQTFRNPLSSKVVWRSQKIDTPTQVNNALKTTSILLGYFQRFHLHPRAKIIERPWLHPTQYDTSQDILHQVISGSICYLATSHICDQPMNN